LAYYPSDRFSGSDYRRIQVSLTGSPASSSLNIRHRTGYYTSKAEF
jgi:hypothetical protein